MQVTPTIQRTAHCHVDKPLISLWHRVLGCNHSVNRHSTSVLYEAREKNWNTVLCKVVKDPQLQRKNRVTTLAYYTKSRSTEHHYGSLRGSAGHGVHQIACARSQAIVEHASHCVRNGNLLLWA